MPFIHARGGTRAGAVLVASTLLLACQPASQPASEAQASARRTQAAVSAVASAFVVTLPASGAAGVTVALTVKAVDASGAVLPGYTGTVHFASNFPQVAVPADYTFSAADAGIHRFSFTPIAAGVQTVAVTDTAASGVRGDVAMTVTGGAASRYVIANLTSGSALNAGVPATFDIYAYDDWWNDATSYAGAATITSSDPAAVLPAPVPFVGGVALGAKITFNTAGAQWVSATDATKPSMTDTAWALVAAGASATITAPAVTTAGTPGLLASVPAQAAVTYAWSVTGGTITAGAGTNSITFTAGAAGRLTLTCVVTPTATGVQATGTASVTVAAQPVTPTITAPATVVANSTGNTASVVARTGMTYRWTISGGTLTSAGGAAGVTSGTTNTITFTAGAAGTITLTCVEVNAAGAASATASATLTSATGLVQPTIAAASPVTTGATGRTASVTARTGMTYSWTISGGTITSAGGTAGVTSGATNTITYTAGAVGTIALTCVEVSGANTSAAGTASVTVVAAPVSPAITASSSVLAASTGNPASVVARSGMTYTWTISGGTITSAGGAAGVTAGTTNSVTYTAGPVGTLALTCTETNTSGASSAPATAAVAVVAAPPPVTPTIASASPVTAGQTGLTASVTARTGMTYAWTISGGTITSAGGAAGVTAGTTNTITYAAGAAGTLSLTCVESNGSTSSAPGTAAVSVAAAPATPVVSAPASAQPNAAGLVASVTARAGMTYAWTVSGGTITSAGGTAGVSSGTTNSVTFSVASTPVVTISCVEHNAAGASSAPGSATLTLAMPSGTGVLFSVAHQDDDTIFFDPDVEDRVRAGTPVRVVWVMAGSSSAGTAAWTARESQAKVMLALAAGATSNWTCSTRTFLAKKQVQACTLAGVPNVSAYFVRMPDGGLSSLWATSSGAPFYVTPVTSLVTADGTTQYTRSELIQTLTAIIADFAPGRIATMDSSLAYGDDHQDHIASGLFTLEAARAWGVPHQYRVHRGYSVDLSVWGYPAPLPENANLSAVELAEKDRLMLGAYGLTCATGGFSSWCARHYATVRISRGTGALVEPGGFCVDTLGGATAAGTQLVIAPCSGSATQVWTVSPAGAVTNGAGCLAVGANGASAQLAACSGATAQSWMLFSNGQLRGPGASCLGVGADGSSLEAQVCDADRSTGRYVPLQQFGMRYGALSAASQLSDADIGGSAAAAATFRVADVDGDGYADACVRRSDGLVCAFALPGGGFGTPRLVSADFSDAAGWLPDAYGSTLQLADVNGDGRADACARGPSGIVCALAGPGGTFGPASRWSVGTDFSDAAGFAASPGTYRSLRFGDVNGDGLVDACARASSGVVCALNTGLGTFGPAQLWSSGEFTDAAGFQTESTGATLMLGDLDGDGKADVCLRGAAGLRCARSSGTTFVRAHLYSFRDDFSDAAGWSARRSLWGSLRMVDVNGDGLADVCGRSASGLVCALSHGVAFDTARQMLPGFSDLFGWQPDLYGPSVAFGDVNHDGRLEVCARSASGVVCAPSP